VSPRASFQLDYWGKSILIFFSAAGSVESSLSSGLTVQLQYTPRGYVSVTDRLPGRLSASPH
jgi:hypothetical protein